MLVLVVSFVRFESVIVMEPVPKSSSGSGPIIGGSLPLVAGPFLLAICVLLAVFSILVAKSTVGSPSGSVRMEGGFFLVAATR